jgi:Mrp family chromosome partitioning ATPase
MLTYDVIEVANKRSGKRILQVFGFPGCGKSAITVKAANYLADRNQFKNGIIFLSLG